MFDLHSNSRSPSVLCDRLDVHSSAASSGLLELCTCKVRSTPNDTCAYDVDFDPVPPHSILRSDGARPTYPPGASWVHTEEVRGCDPKDGRRIEGASWASLDFTSFTQDYFSLANSLSSLWHLSIVVDCHKRKLVQYYRSSFWFTLTHTVQDAPLLFIQLALTGSAASQSMYEERRGYDPGGRDRAVVSRAPASIAPALITPLTG